MFKGEPWEQEDRPMRELVSRFERALAGNAPAFFEDEDLEQIIEHYQDHDQAGKALAAADYALELNPYNAAFHLRRADALFELRRFDEAWASTEQAAALDPSDVEIYYIRADLHVQREEFRQAIGCLEEALLRADEDEHEAILVEMAEVHGDLGDFDRMFDALRQALERNPDSEDALDRLAYCVDVSERYEEGLTLCRALIDRDPYALHAWYTLGKAFIGMGLYEKAIDAFGYATAIDERYRPVYRDLGEAWFRLGDYREAMAAFLQAVDRDDPRDGIYYRIGQCRERLGELAGARHHYLKALQVDPYHDGAQYRIACTYLAENKPELALRHLRKAADIAPDRAEYRMELGRLFEAMDDPDRALLSFREALRLRPDYASHWVKYSRLLFENGDREGAVRAAEDALAHCGDLPLLFYLHGACLLGAGRRREGAVSLGRAMDLDAASHPVLFELFPDLERDPLVLDLIDQYSR